MMTIERLWLIGLGLITIYAVIDINNPQEVKTALVVGVLMIYVIAWI